MMGARVPDDIIFQAWNNHLEDAGIPPHLDGNAKDKYSGYFRNEHGEQSLFVYDYQTKKGILWMGDNGWEEAIPVMDGEATDTILTKSESLWLRACWFAAVGP
jgi:hypothetical protein